MSTSKNFPSVTERKYYKYASQGMDVFKGTGFTIKAYKCVHHRTNVVDKPKQVCHETHNDFFVLINNEWEYCCSVIDVSKEKKQRCIGGPLDGQLKAESQALEYTRFNSFNRSSKINTVLIHNELLKDNK